MKNATAKLVSDPGAIVVNATAEGEAAPGFEGIAYSGGIVSRSTLSVPIDADYVIDLADFSTGRSVKVNLDHKTNQRVGHLTEATTDGKQLTVKGLLSAATPHRDEVALSAKNGYGWEVSIEAALGKPRKIEKGKTETINGRQVAGPLYVFKGRLSGLGFVSNGADAGNSITVAASEEQKTITLRELRELLK